MRKLYIYCIFVGSVLLLALGLYLPKQPSASVCRNDYIEKSSSLMQILKTLNIKHDDTLDSIVSQTQAQWLRPPNKERWEVKDKFEQYRADLMPYIQKLGMVEAIHASKKYYDYAVILGALTQTVVDRLDFLIKEWSLGVRFGALVFLSGERALIDSEYSVFGNFSREQVSDEREMVKLIYRRAQMPVEMKNIPVVFVEAAAKQGATRANTADTVMAWLSLNPESGTVLAVSSQPYILYQESVLKSFLPLGFTVYGIGAAALDKSSIAVYLDNLARLLYQEKQRRTAFECK